MNFQRVPPTGLLRRGGRLPPNQTFRETSRRGIKRDFFTDSKNV
jgi:hypothetical protein